MALVDVDVNVADIQESLSQTISDVQQSFNQAMAAASNAFNNAYQFIQNSLNDAQEKRNWAYQYTSVSFGLKTESEYNEYCSERRLTLSDELAQMKPHWFLNASMHIGHGLSRFLFKDSIISLLNHLVRCANFLFDPAVPYTNSYNDHTDKWKHHFTFKKFFLEGIGHILSIPIYAATLALGFLGLRKQGLMQIYAAADKVSSWLSRIPSEKNLLDIFSPGGGVFGLIGASLVMFEGAILLLGGISNKGLNSVRMGWRRANGQLDNSQFIQPFWKGGLGGVTLGTLAFCAHLAINISVCLFSNMRLGVMASLKLAKWFVINHDTEGEALLLPKPSNPSSFTPGHFLKGGFFALPIIGFILGMGIMFSILGISQQGFVQLLNSFPKAWSLLSSKPSNPSFETIFDFHGGLLGNLGALVILTSAATLAALGFSNKGLHSIKLGIQGKLASADKKAPPFWKGGIFGVSLGFAAYAFAKATQLVWVVAHNMRTAINDSWKIGRWVVGVSDNNAPLNWQTFWRGGFFALPFQLVIINSAIILAILGLTNNGLSQFKKSFIKAKSFVSSKPCLEPYHSILHPQGGLLGTLGSGAVLTASVLLAVFGLSNKGINSIRLGIQGKLSSVDKKAPPFWKGGFFGISLGLMAFTLSHGAQLFLTITRNIRTAITDSWNVGKWVVGYSDNSSAINLKTLGQGGFFALPIQLVIINSAIILAVLGLSNNGLSQFKKSFVKAKSFVSSKPCLEPYHSILHPKGGLLGTLGSGAVLTVSVLLAVFGLSNKGINSIRLGTQGKLSSEDKTIPTFWKGGIFGVSLGLSTFAITRVMRLIKSIVGNMGTSISNSWNVGKWVLGFSDNDSTLDSQSFWRGGFFALPLQLIILNSAVLLAILGLTKNGCSQFKRSFEKASSFVSAKSCDESYSSILLPQGGILGMLGSVVVLTGGLLLTVFGLSNKGLHSIQLGIKGKLSSTNKSAPVFWKGGLLGVNLGLTAFTIFHGLQLVLTVTRNMRAAISDSWKVGKWVVGASDDNSAINSQAFWHGGFFALPLQVLIVGLSGLLVIGGISKYGFNQLGQSLAKGISFITARQNNTTLKPMLHPKGGALGMLGSVGVLTSTALLACLGFSNKGFNSIKLGIRGTLSSEDENSLPFWKGGVFGVSLGLTAYCISKVVHIISMTMANMYENLSKSLVLSLWIASGTDYEQLPTFHKKCFIKGGFLVLPLMGLFLFSGIAISLLGLTKFAVKSARFGFATTKHLLVGCPIDNATKLSRLEFLRGGIMGISLGLTPLVGLGVAYIGVAVPLAAVFRIIKRVFQAVKSACQIMGVINNNRSETVQRLEGLKQFSVTNPEAWRRPISNIDKQVNKHLCGAKNSGGYTLSFWNGLQKDVYRTFSLNVSSLREQVVAIITRYARRHERFDVSKLRDVEMENLVFDNPLTFQNLGDEIAQFFRENGQSLIRLKERFRSRMTENEFKMNIVQSLKYAGTLFAPPAARGDIQESELNIEAGFS